MIRVLILFVVCISSALAYVHKPTGEMTCTIEGVAVEIYLEDYGEAVGTFDSGEVVVARSVYWSKNNNPSLAMLREIDMEIEFPFRLEGQFIKCALNEPSEWWFDDPKAWEVIEKYAPETNNN